MSTVIRVSCPTEGCGTQRVTNSDVTLRMLEGEDSGQYTFKCPVCLLWATKEASVHIVGLLKDADVRVVVLTLPEELYDPNRSSGRAVVSLDDVLDIHEALEQDDFIERLTWGEQ